MENAFTDREGRHLPVDDDGHTRCAVTHRCIRSCQDGQSRQRAQIRNGMARQGDASGEQVQVAPEVHGPGHGVQRVATRDPVREGAVS